MAATVDKGGIQSIHGFHDKSDNRNVNELLIKSYYNWRQLAQVLLAPSPAKKGSLTSKQHRVEAKQELVSRQDEGDEVNEIYAGASEAAIKFWVATLHDYVPAGLPEFTQARDTQPSVSSQIDISATQAPYLTGTPLGFGFPIYLQAAWALVLGTYTTTSDVLFAYKPPNRNVLLAGQRLQFLYRRVRIDRTKSTSAFLRDLHSSDIEAASHQNCSEARLELELHRRLDSLCSSALVVQYTGDENLDIALEEGNVSAVSSPCRTFMHVI